MSIDLLKVLVLAMVVAIVVGRFALVLGIFTRPGTRKVRSSLLGSLASEAPMEQRLHELRKRTRRILGLSLALLAILVAGSIAVLTLAVALATPVDFTVALLFAAVSFTLTFGPAALIVVAYTYIHYRVVLRRMKRAASSSPVGVVSVTTPAESK